MPDTKRVNILVISFPRSESIFISGVFYLFEPLQTVQKLLCSSLISHLHLIKLCYSKLFRILINNCKFARDIFTRYLNRQNLCHHLALSSPFCVRNGMSTVCQKLKTRQFEDFCKNNYIVFAAKLLTPRILNSRGEWKK